MRHARNPATSLAIALVLLFGAAVRVCHARHAPDATPWRPSAWAPPAVNLIMMAGSTATKLMPKANQADRQRAPRRVMLQAPSERDFLLPQDSSTSSRGFYHTCDAVSCRAQCPH